MQPTNEVRLLKERLLGLWDVNLSRTMPDGSKMVGKGTIIGKEIALGHAIFAEYALTIPDMEPYMEGELWWFDKKDHKVHLFCVTSREESRDHVGEWKDENTLVVRWKGRQDGKEMTTEFTFTWRTTDDIHVLGVSLFGGQKGPVSVFTMRRAKEIALSP